MAEVREMASGSSSPAPESVSTSPSPSPPLAPDMPVKIKGRHRLLRGIQRISSTPSLTGLRRSRSVGSPYSTRSTLSCVSLAATGPPSTPGSARSSTPQTSPLGYPSSSSTTTYTSTGEFPFESIASHLAVRRVEAGTPASSYATVPLPADLKAKQVQKPPFRFWDVVPYEVQIHIFSFLRPKELVQASRVSKAFYKSCFDGQLWTTLDASEFYQEIPAESLSRIIVAAGPFIKDLNLRGCVQVEHYKRTEAIVKACKNLMNATLEGCENFHKCTLHTLLRSNEKLVSLNLTGLAAVSNTSCTIISESCPQLEIDILTDLPVVPPRNLRHLDLSRCELLTDVGVKALGHQLPNLEGLQLSRCKLLTDTALEPILASTPRLTHLELEDLENLTNTLLSEHLAKAPCASTLEHLSLSYCENLGDMGVLPVMQKCVGLRRADLDNTRISDLVLAEAASMVNKRSKRSLKANKCPELTLQMDVYDCQNVTWTGIREVLFRNTQVKPAAGHPGRVSYPTEVIGLKCFYGFQMTVDEHQKRVLRNDLASAGRLERKWADYMQASEEAGMAGAGYRRRRRRAREAQALHLDEEDGVVGVNGRRRARTLGSCAVM
ncbi:hypothetical protein AUP68_13166 [Ilyonectria robusta]